LRVETGKEQYQFFLHLTSLSLILFIERTRIERDTRRLPVFRRGLLRIVLGLIICSCGGGGGAQSTSFSDHSRTSVPPRKETPPLSEREQLLAEAERSWAKRDEREHVENAIEYWRRALSLDSDDIEIWNRISRAHLFLVELLCVHPAMRSAAEEINTDDQNARDSAGESPSPNRAPVEPVAKRKPFSTDLSECQSLLTETEEKVRQSEQIDLLQKGKEAAEQALALHTPEILKQIEGNEASIESLDTVEMKAVPALYWRSTTLDELSRTKGYTERVIQKDVLIASMAYCLDNNPQYDYAGPHRYFGTFFARPLSLADKDLEKSRKHFERAIAIAPGFLANRYAFARYYAVMAQDRKTFETQLRTILEANIERDPSTAPENRIYRRKAEILLRLASEYFE
jgi:tetratricopeptide (TPR) repeat protein